MKQNFLFIAHEGGTARVLSASERGREGKSMGWINALARVAHAQEEGEEGMGSDSIDDLASISISSPVRQIVIAPLSECTEGRGS